ncbi:sulfite exporter TauE/SafE family protein [Actinomyces wuliandei]|uniref:sulfite exporter TauE/SafE family protein n=1 Tax=Actinomyces wuliandei TaxID=2057743 RepID=UPI000FD8E10F|nr:sulfite exporter TauE/SafE family protein [Actinomyces wuliandei]
MPPPALPLPDLSPLSWTALVLAAALAGVAKTVLPGAAAIAVALCAALLPARESTGAMLLMLMTGDLVAVWSYRRDADVRMLLRLVPAVLAGVAAGAVFLRLATDSSTRRVIGAVLLLLIAVTLVQRYRQRAAAPLSTRGAADSASARLVYGTLAGFTTMVANAGGPVTSMYFLACRYPVKAFLGTTAWFFFVVNLVKLPFSVSIGLVNPTTVSLAAVTAPVVVVVALAGRRLAERMDQRVFEPLVITLTVVSALPLLL